MINHLLTILTSVIIYEFLRRVQFIYTIRSNLNLYNKILKLFKFKNVSDLRKEKLILNYSKSLLITSIKILLIIFAIIIFILIVNLLSDTFLKFLLSILGILEVSFIFIIFHLIRVNINAKL